MGRLGTPQEIALAIAILLAEPSGFITGQALCEGGGASEGKAGFSRAPDAPSARRKPVAALAAR